MEGSENSEGREVQKEAISEGVVGGFSSIFFSGGVRDRLMNKLSVILLLIGVSKEKFFFSLMIFYMWLAECFFHGLHCRRLIN